MKKYLATFAIAAVLSAPGFAADSYTIDPDFSAPAFDIEHLGFITQHGRFKKVRGNVTLDFEARKGSVDFIIDTTSIDMGSAAMSAHLADEGLFNVKKFPTMVFKSDKLIFDGNRVVAAEGQFTMIGVTRPVKLAVSGFQCKPHPANKKALCTGNIAASLNRSEFGLTKYIPEVSDLVKISVPVEAYKN